jgi:phage minor structural protein
MIVTDLNGNSEILFGCKDIKRVKSVEGDKTLSFTAFLTDQNSEAYFLLINESTIEFMGHTYRVKQANRKSIGNTYYKEITATHSFFDLNNEYVYDTLDVSQKVVQTKVAKGKVLKTRTEEKIQFTIDQLMGFTFDGYDDYTWEIIGTFPKKTIDQFGDDNPMSLFQKILSTFVAEYYLTGDDDKHIVVMKAIGSETDFQFRYNHNIKTYSEQVDTKDLTTYIKGFGAKDKNGKVLVTSEYTSPNADIYGVRHSKPVRDEGMKTVADLDVALKAAIKDVPDISITIDFVDMRRAGFPYDVPNEGDSVFLIYDPMNINSTARIMDVTETFEENFDLPIETTVTLANYKRNLTRKMTRFNSTENSVNQIMSGERRLPLSAMSQEVEDTIRGNVFYDEVSYDKLRDSVSSTDYYITTIPHLDSNGDVIELQHGFANDSIGSGIGETARSFSERYAATIVINASTFDTTTMLLAGNQIADGVIIQDSPPTSRWSLGIKSDNTLVPYPPNTTAATMLSEGCLNAITAFFPMIQGGVAVDSSIYSSEPNTTTADPRQVIAQMPNKDIIILSCDGRTTINIGMTYSDCIRILLGLGVETAFCLDGGGSTQTIVRGTMINLPIDDNGKTERKVSDFLYVDSSSVNAQNINRSTSDLGEVNKRLSDLISDLTNGRW